MKVKLEDVLEAMDFVNDDTQYYYDVKNEKVLMIFDGMIIETVPMNVLRKNGAKNITLILLDD